jgi:hypothetical protein
MELNVGDLVDPLVELALNSFKEFMIVLFEMSKHMR